MDYKIDFFVSYRVLLSIRWKITKNIGTFKKCYVDAGYRSLLLELPGAIISVMIKNLIEKVRMSSDSRSPRRIPQSLVPKSGRTVWIE